jgi:ABC-type antimicrobial peptide transport system permease subunit
VLPVAQGRCQLYTPSTHSHPIRLDLGTALGLPVGLALSTFAGELAFEMGDFRYPLLTARTAALLLVTAVVAGAVPSRRASRLDVMGALRCD